LRLRIPNGSFTLKARPDASQTGAEAPAAGAGVLVTYVSPAGRDLRVPSSFAKASVDQAIDETRGTTSVFADQSAKARRATADIARWMVRAASAEVVRRVRTKLFD